MTFWHLTFDMSDVIWLVNDIVKCQSMPVNDSQCQSLTNIWPTLTNFDQIWPIFDKFCQKRLAELSEFCKKCGILQTDKTLNFYKVFILVFNMLQKITEYELVNKKTKNQFWVQYLQYWLKIDYLENKKRPIFLMMAEFDQSFTNCIQAMNLLVLSMFFYIIKMKDS